MTSRFEQAKAILRRNGGAPSLIASFLILHEITAIVPFGLTFYASRQLGLGNSIVNSLVSGEYLPQYPWIHQSVRSVVTESEARMARVGSRYGVFGYSKGEDRSSSSELGASPLLAGDFANAVVAYVTVKALLPVRIGLSLYLSPALSRSILEPSRRLAVNLFSRKQ